MGNHLRADKPPWYINIAPDQLSLAILVWVGAMSTSEIWGINST